MPNGANYERARNAERRQMPDGARSHTARNPERRQTAGDGGAAGSQPAASRRWPLAPSGAVWHFALFGIPRRSGFRAVWHLAPFGTWRRSAFAPVNVALRVALHAESRVAGAHDRLGPRRRAELPEDVRHMVADRLVADAQPLGDVAVGEPARDEPEHLGLAVGEPGKGARSR